VIWYFCVDDRLGDYGNHRSSFATDQSLKLVHGIGFLTQHLSERRWSGASLEDSNQEVQFRVSRTLCFSVKARSSKIQIH
jgi:hypothetical protein